MKLKAHRATCCQIMTLLVLSWSSLAASDECDNPAGKLVSVEGDVSIADSPVLLNQTICSGDAIEVGALSRAAVRLETTQTVVRIDQNSTFMIKPSDAGNSWLELIKGAIYLFSRQPQSLRVETPYVNAAIDGTEFVIKASEEIGEVTVIEGSVLASNALGEVRLVAGEKAFAGVGFALKRRIVVDPVNAVQWALHYPRIGASENTDEVVRFAAELLARGDVERAEALLEDTPDDAASLALETIIAVTRNRLVEATRLAEEAVSVDAASSVAYTALSYTQQARFKIEQSLSSAKIAVRNDPENADAIARQAELELGVDDTAAALTSARKAIALAPNNSRSHTVLGFARLIRLEVNEAKVAFTRAVTLDQGDPLPRLGLGLAIIREGSLVDGREHLEVAAALDPNDALVRSYLGKAYAEERESEDAAAQFVLAKKLDPQDPTPWFYDALLAQALNRPAEAFRSIERARALNDNRLVYQSRLLVDKDEAAGSLSLARIYTDLGFGQLAINESARSIETDPTNSSAYRFLADSYSGRQRLDTARRSALFQAALLQPLTINPVQPYAQESDLLTLPGTDPIDPSIREYTPLFKRDGVQLAGSIVGGGNDTLANNLVFSGVHGRVAYSLGQFRYRTDGFRENADIEHDVVHGLLQAQVQPNLFLQAAVHRQTNENGDLSTNFNQDEFNPELRIERDSTLPYVALRGQLKSRRTLLVALRAIDRSRVQVEPFIPPQDSFLTRDFKGPHLLARYTQDIGNIRHTIGVDAYKLDFSLNAYFTDEPEETAVREKGPASYVKNYYYVDFNVNKRFYWTLGVSYTTLDDEVENIDTQLVGPHLGLRWQPHSSHELRFALSRGLKGQGVADLSLESPILAGFNRFHNDDNGTSHTSVGIAYDRRIDPSTRAGLQISFRSLDAFIITLAPDGSDPLSQSIKETEIGGYWSRVFSSNFGLAIEPLYERLENRDALLRSVETLSLPTSLQFFHRSGLFLQTRFSFVHQSIEHDINSASINTESNAERDSDTFSYLDLSLGTRFKSSRATLRLDVLNVFDEEFLFQSTQFPVLEPSAPRFSPGRTIVGRVSFSFR